MTKFANKTQNTRILTYSTSYNNSSMFTAALRACVSTICLAIFTVLPETVEYYYLMVSARFIHYTPFWSVGIFISGTPLVQSPCYYTRVLIICYLTEIRYINFLHPECLDFKVLMDGLLNNLQIEFFF